MIDLTKFCAQKNDIRKYLQAPWVHKGFTYAANNHLVVRIATPGSEEVIFDHEVAEGAVCRFERAHADGFHLLPAFTIADKCSICGGAGECRHVDCQACEGEGSFNHFGVTYNCRSCDGDGTIPDHDPEYKDGDFLRCGHCRGTGYESKTVEINDAGFQSYYLAWIKELPGLQIATDGPHNAMHFKFDGGSGFLMPMC